jgi:hypothetical protein
MADAEQLADIEAALGDLAEAVLMGAGKELVRSNPYLCSLVTARREREAAKYQALVEAQRAARAERHAANEQASRV